MFAFRSVMFVTFCLILFVFFSFCLLLLLLFFLFFLLWLFSFFFVLCLFAFVCFFVFGWFVGWLLGLLIDWFLCLLASLFYCLWPSLIDFVLMVFLLLFYKGAFWSSIFIPLVRYVLSHMSMRPSLQVCQRKWHCCGWIGGHVCSWKWRQHQAENKSSLSHGNDTGVFLRGL